MPHDPALPMALSVEARLARRIAELEARLDAVDRRPTIQAADGAPTSSPRSGTPYVDETAARLYLRVGGAWRYVALT